MRKEKELFPPLTKRMLTRRMCIFVCFLCMMALQAMAQDARRMTLHLKNATMTEFVRQIKQQTGYAFFYNNDVPAMVEPVNVDKKNAPLEEVLREVLVPKGYTFTIEDRTIIIKKAASVPAQKSEVSGTVVDERGLALPGVNVVVKGTDLGTTTDMDGKFTLTLSKPNPTLTFTFVGMETQEIRHKGQREMKVRMKEAQAEIEEVVVTGMFTRKANSYTGAVTTIKGDDLKAVGNGNVLQSLKNIDPSFMMVEDLSAGSDPNTLPNIQMRGQTGFSEVVSEYQENPNQPLFILNGFETTMTKILDLDMNLVESVTLLKDATAKAIYGSKAANGVVVVETRRPGKGRMKISYTGSVDIEAPDLSSYDLCNAMEKLQAERNAGFYSSESAKAQIEKDQQYSLMLRDVLAGVDTYWLDKPLRVGVGQKHSLYLEGGDDYMLYGVNLSYNDVAGVMKGSNRSVLNGGITLSYRYKKLSFRNQLSIDDNNSSDSPYGTFSQYAKLNPYNRIYDDDGKMNSFWTNNITEYNYLKNGSINTRYDDKYTMLTENFYVEYQATRDLRLTARFGLIKKNSESEGYKPADHTDFINYSGDRAALKGSYAISQRKDNTISADLGAAYSVQLDKHLFFLNAQYSLSRQKYDYYALTAEGLPNENMDHISMAVQYQGTKPTGGEGITRDMGIVSSLNYSYNDRYLVDINYRLTGSSDFGADNRWGSFYSFGAGWNMHQEDFLKDASWLTRLKLRVSTGYTGSQGFSSYAAVPTLNYYQETYQGKLGSYLLGLANSDLAWQKKYDTNVGMDLSLFEGNLNGRFDYYIATTKGTITSVSTPPSTGFSSYTANLGEVENKGWEASLNWRIWRDAKTASYVTLYASASANKNVLKKVSNSLKALNDKSDEQYETDKTNTAIPVRYEEGSSMTAIWVVKSLGIDPETGKEVFVKKDGSLTYDWSSSDYIDGGDSRPKVSGNFGVNMEYRGFGLNAGFTWRLGGQIYNETLLSKVENADLRYNVDRRVFKGRWSEPGQIARFKSIADDSYTQPTSRFVEDYNTLTFSSLSLSYDFRECKFMRNSFLERMKATFYMNDLFTLSSVKIERGTSYPFARTFSFSLQLNF